MSGVFLKHCVYHEKSTPHCPQQNGRAERQIRTLVEGARSILQTFNSNKSLWAEIVNSVAYIRNLLPLERLNFKTPHEI
jgi:hypothetical protein